MTKNIAADLHAQNLSGEELQTYLEEQMDELEEQLTELPTHYETKWHETPHTSNTTTK